MSRLYEIKIFDYFQPSRPVAVYWADTALPDRDPHTGDLISPDGIHWDHWRYSAQIRRIYRKARLNASHGPQ